MNKFIGYFNFARKTSLLPEYRCLTCQLLEIVVVFVLRGIGPGYYIMAEMGGKQHGWNYKLGFLNGRQYVKRVDSINDPESYILTFNKVNEKSMLTESSISTPRMLGYLSLERGHVFDDGADLKTVDDFRAFIINSA